MTSKLKNLYKHLIENRKSEVQIWHDAYKEFFEEAAKILEQLKEGRNFCPSTDKEFLQRLLFEKDNGIASRGQSTLSEKHFNSFINNSEFIAALKELMLKTKQENYMNLREVWHRLKDGNNPVLINRVVAACTHDVSTTVDESKFNTVFEWLVKEGAVEPYPAGAGQDWLSKNKHLMNAIKKEFSEEPNKKDTDEFYLGLFVWLIYENVVNPFSLKKQIVKYGPPGTGKTYQAKQQAELALDIWKEEFAPESKLTHESQIELVQFHPSYTYEDFMEGLRPALKNRTAQLTLQNGVFKEFCKRAGKWEIDFWWLGFKQKWEDITISDLSDHAKSLGADWQYIFEIEDKQTKVADAVPPFFFVIDEINRAELSRVFGELMYCLEYRGVGGSIKTQYANLNKDKTGMFKRGGSYQFFIPSNVYIIGTMNTIDRSIESFDFALRRRFRWEEVPPDTRLLEFHLKEKHEDWAVLASNLESLNSAIAKEPLLGSDYQIGHAYLWNLRYSKKLTPAQVRKNIWEDSICPLVQEYLRGSGKEDKISSLGKEFGVE